MRKLYGLVIFTILFTGCAKKAADDDPYVYISGSGLSGKWVATERFISPGSGGTWNSLPSDQRFTIEFRADGSFTCSANFHKADSLFSRYEISGTRLVMSNADSSKTDTWYFRLDGGERLEMSTVLCIEGCPWGLRRIQ